MLYFCHSGEFADEESIKQNFFFIDLLLFIHPRSLRVRIFLLSDDLQSEPKLLCHVYVF